MTAKSSLSDAPTMPAVAPRDREPKPPFPPQHQEQPGREARLNVRPRFQAEEYHAAGKLKGRAALITGGDSGIGRAVAVLFAREGADIAINYLAEEQEDAEETRRVVEKAGRKCVLIPGDLRERDFCDQLIQQTVEKLGHLEILVSNAAHQSGKSDLEELSDEELEHTFQTNVFACFRLVRAALPHLPAGAAIVITTSETGIFGSKNLPDYSSTKGALNALTKALAMKLLEKGIRVNAVAPGPVWTPLNPSDPGSSAEDVSKFGQKSPMGRPAQPEELAPAYVFLASNADSSYITGSVLQVMGGETTGG
ncbi:MAG TPA: SDR family oxidoreductase [Opitutaceae bacterium]|nr:SDR family oxidoreductase [Opitutaceae bacterium]